MWCRVSHAMSGGWTALGRVKRLAIWVWLHEYGGKQFDIARVTGIDMGVVSDHCGQAMRTPGDYDEEAVPWSPCCGAPGERDPAWKTDATEDARPVRSLVDV